MRIEFCRPLKFLPGLLGLTLPLQRLAQMKMGGRVSRHQT